MPRPFVSPSLALHALAALGFAVAIGGCAASSGPGTESPLAAAPRTAIDTIPGVTPSPPTAAPRNGIRPYAQVIPATAVSDEGLFTLHRVDRRMYYELPDSLLGRDMLLISQIAQAPEDLSPFQNAGINVAEQVVRWERDGNRVLLRTVSYRNVAPDSIPISASVRANTFAPILRSFAVEAESPNGNGVVIEAGPLFLEDVPAIGPFLAAQRTQLQIRRLDQARGNIDSARSFPLNVEVRHTLTYEAGNPPSQARTQTISIQMAQSMVLLPAEPMRPRIFDARVGWFTVNQVDFGSDEYKASTRSLIRRWRLEPSDPVAYARGEVVDPVAPIVFYLDPATPDEWRPFILQGVEDWQDTFESAGFSNAILAREPPSPEEDPDFSPEDVRYNMVRYTANLTRNAMGPSVSDPRTGEIIASDIIWYHNHLRSYRNRLMVETGAADPTVRSLRMDREVIGEAVRQVIAHEIGHALGLPHNMIASSSFPVDSLRSPTFTARHGVAPSVMDYARQNYVAQPGDGVTRFVRMIGPYDHYSVEWGYRVIPEAATPEDEVPILDRWIRARADDPMYRFALPGPNFDPRNQTEDIGNDPVRASGFGIANLKRVLPNLVEWTSTPGQGYADLEELYGELVSSWSRYLGHVVAVVGGVYAENLTSDYDRTLFSPVESARQREAMAFLSRELFTTPTWLNEPAVIRRIEGVGALNRIRGQQTARLSQLLDPTRMVRMVEAEFAEAGDPYLPGELFADVRRAVWGELEGSAAIDPYRRNLQRAHIERLTAFISGDAANPAFSDGSALGRAELVELQRAITSRIGRAGDALTIAHLRDQLARIMEVLEG